MQKILHIVQHASFEKAGEIEDWFKSNDYKISYTRVYEELKFPNVHSIDVLVVMGGPMGVYDINDYPWLVEEKNYIKAVIASGKKVIGICLGAQLIADCLGAKVTRNRYKEIGWFPVHKNVSADFLVDEEFESFFTLHWHGDTFDIPEGAQHIFKSEACDNQGYILNDHILGLQFHPEVKLENIKELINNSVELQIPEKYIQNHERIISGYDKYANKNRLFLHKLLKQFC